MPHYRLPPPLPFFLNPAAAFGPARMWVPEGCGTAMRELVARDDAILTGSYSWGAGAFGRCLATSGGSALTAGVLGGLPAGPLSITIAHYRPPDALGSFPDLIGWGDGFNGQYGIGYQPSNFGLTNFSGVPINQVALGYPTDKWRIITVTFAGMAAGSAIEYWADGARIYAGTLPSDFPAPSRFRIAASNNGNLIWRGSIGPIYAHARALSGDEIRPLHADIWRGARDSRGDYYRKVFLVPPPVQFEGSAFGPGPIASGELDAVWELEGSAYGPSPIAEGDFGVGWELEGSVLGPVPIASGSLEWVPPPPYRRTINSRALIHRVAIHPVVVSTDSAGAPRSTWPNPRSGQESVRCRVVEFDGATIDRYRKLGRECVGIAYFPPRVAPIEPSDQLVWQGKRYAISAPPRDVHGRGHHTEVELLSRVI